MRKLSESATLWAVLTATDRVLLRIALVCAIAYYGWGLAAQTAVQLIAQNQQITALQAQLKAASK